MPCSAYSTLTQRVTARIIARNTFAPASVTRSSGAITIQHAHFHVTTCHQLQLSSKLVEPLEQSRYDHTTSAHTDDFYLPFIQPDSASQRLECGSVDLQKSSAVKPWDGGAPHGEDRVRQTPRDKMHSPIEQVKKIFSPNDNTGAHPGLVGTPEQYPATFQESSSQASMDVPLVTSESSPPNQFIEASARGPSYSAQSQLQKHKSKMTSGSELSKKISLNRPGIKRENWQIQKAALSSKFGATGWAPRKRLSPDALEGIRALHAQFPTKFTTPVLANQFEVSPDAIRRILKSKWRPRDEEVDSRRQRWDKRGERIWGQMVALGVKPPKKWREVSDHFPSSILSQTPLRNTSFPPMHSSLFLRGVCIRNTDPYHCTRWV